jgi:glucose-6-phosphate isomerase
MLTPRATATGTRRPWSRNARDPSNTLFAPTLTPRVLGQLLAAYEHKHFVQQVLVAPDARRGLSRGGPTGPYAELH